MIKCSITKVKSYNTLKDVMTRETATYKPRLLLTY